MARTSQRIQISLNEKLLVRVDNFCEKNYLTRSGFLAMCCTQFLDGQEILEQMGAITEILNKFSNDQELTSDELEKLESYQKLCDMYGTIGQ